MLVQIEDITARRDAEQRLSDLALRDQLDVSNLSLDGGDTSRFPTSGPSTHVTTEIVGDTRRATPHPANRKRR